MLHHGTIDGVLHFFTRYNPINTTDKPNPLWLKKYVCGPGQAELGHMHVGVCV